MRKATSITARKKRGFSDSLLGCVDIFISKPAQLSDMKESFANDRFFDNHLKNNNFSSNANRA